MSLEFDTNFEPAARPAGRASAGRACGVTANNPGPFTFHGTNSYIVGRDELAVIDPGPGRRGASRRAACGDRRAAGQPHLRQPHPSRPFAARRQAQGSDRRHRLRRGAAPPCPAAAGSARSTRSTPAPTWTSCPTCSLPTASVIDGGDWAIRTILTPGHAANHAVFALDGTGIAVFGRPRDGLVDLDRRAARRRDGRLHGVARQAAGAPRQRSSCPAMAARSTQPAKFMRGLKAHRKMRERAILERLRRATARLPRWWRRSTATPIRGCMARPRCRCWRIWRTWSRAASSRPTAIRRSTRNLRSY